MKIVNITDIEDLISAKIDIDKYLISNNKRSEKMSLEYYFQNYVNVDNAYLEHGKNIPFKILKLDNNSEDNDLIYLYISEEPPKKLIDVIESCNYDLTNLKSINVEEIITNYGELDKIDLIIANNTYYKV